MAIESKAEVALDSLSPEEAEQFVAAFGFRSAEQPVRLYGGYASSNFKVIAKKDGEGTSRPFLLKVNYGGLNIEDIEHQLFVMNHLRTCSFPTNYPHPSSSGSLMVEQNGRSAILLDFIHGKSGDKVLAEKEDKAPAILRELAATLARLHQVNWPEERTVRDIRSGYPLCNTGDLLRGEDVEKLKADDRFKDHPFVALVHRQITWLRELYDSKVPWGLIHGDAFLDNTLYEDGPGPDCKLLALIDWEDSCVGPYVVDLAVCASATCFTAANAIMRPRLLVLLKEYQRHRKLSELESKTFVDFMAAGALACGFYRFCEFNVRQPDATAQAKDSYRLMGERAELLLNGQIREEVLAVLEASAA